MTNTYLKYQPPAMQFMAFLGLAAGFYLVNTFITFSLFSDLIDVFSTKNSVITPDVVIQLRWAQVMNTIITFILPALLFGYFSSPQLFRYVGFQPTVSILIVVSAIVLLFAIQPFAGWLGNINSRINYGSLQKIFQEAESTQTRVMETFLKMKGPGDLVLNLFIMALLPAVGEELFFRGAFQKTILRWSNMPWLAILISSSVFALLHSSPFKILPIFALGIMLGRVYYVTRNIWYNITIHFLNNALAVLTLYYGGKSETLKKFANDNLTIPIYFAIIGLAVSIGVIYFMKKRSDIVLPASVTDEDNDYIA